MNKLILIALFLTLACAKTIKQTAIEKGLYEATESDLLEIYESFGYANDMSKYDTFLNNLDKIIAHNTDESQSWTMEVNKFSFMTQEEFQSRLNAGAGQNCSATAFQTFLNPNKITKVEIPTEVDWRKKGVVTPVKDQGNCGSCWTFSTTGCLESHWALKTGHLLELAEQQLVDCAQDFDNHGCNGGLPSNAFEYIRYSGGMESEKSYPYTQKDGKCHVDATKFVAHAPGGSHNITFQNEDELLQAVATVGPVSIAFDCMDSFMGYSGGVYTDPKCPTDPKSVNHAVLVVGYGTNSDNVPYWIIKNSWGTDWGLEGYFLMKRGVNQCGIADCAAYPIVN